MSPDLFGPIARHEPDDQRSNDGNSNCIDTELIADWRSESRTESLIVKDICEKTDQFKQKPRNICANHADHDRHQHDRHYVNSGCEIAEFLQGRLMPSGLRRLTHADSFPVPLSEPA